MKDFTLNIQPRSETGSAAMRRFRRQGMIPSVFYGRGNDPVTGLLSDREFRQLAQQSRRSQVFTFKSESGTLNGRKGIVKDVQQDYVANKVLHVDFQILHENEEIHVDVPLKISGEAPGVKLENGILTVVSHELAISCLPKHIPDSIEVDISSLGLGQSIHARDLSLPEGVRLHGNPDETIVSVVAARQTRVEEAEAAAAAEGAAPAAGAEKSEAKEGK